VCGLEMGSAYCKEADRGKSFLRIERADPLGTRIERSKGGNGKIECRAGFLTNDVGPDSPVVCIAWAFLSNVGFCRIYLLTYLPTFLGNHASKFRLDRKMKGKSLDIKPYLYLRSWERKKEVMTIHLSRPQVHLQCLHIYAKFRSLILVQCITKISK